MFGAWQGRVDLEEACRRFYAYFPDEYDFLTVRPAAPVANGVHGINFTVRNDIQGIGEELHDESDLWGSAGALRSVLFINFRLMGPIIHELAHTWANHLSLFDSERTGSHWSLSDVDGVLGGDPAGIEALGDGNFAVYDPAYTSDWGGRYADLELYLMGLLPADQVEPHTILKAHSYGFDETRNRQIIKGRLDTVTIEDIIAREGPRVPGFEDAPKAFRMATIVVSREPLNPASLSYYDRQAAFVASDADREFAFAAATGHRATLETRLDGASTVVLVGDTENQMLPKAAQLRQNYPNPFNGGTIIAFELERAAKVELAIYNLIGQRVTTLMAGPREEGIHVVRWDGRDDSGRELASGPYLYRLQNGEEVETRKLLLLR